MKRVSLLFPVTLAVLLLVSCIGQATVCDSCFHETANYTCVCPFSVENGDNLASLYLQVNLESGAITWTLRDPSGNVRWEDHCEASNEPELITYRKFSTPAAGDWYLEMYLEDAIGEYCGVWKTQ